MAEKYLSEQHFDFSGGVNQSVSRLLMANNEANYLENVEVDKIGSLYKTKGYIQKGATVHATYPILGIVNAIKPSTGITKQIAIADGASNSDAYTYNPVNDTWTPHGLSLSTGAKAEFESYLDGFFMVNFADATRWNDLTAWSTVTNVTNAAKARYIKQYLSRLYLGYVVSGGTTFPSRVTYSDLPTGGNPWNLTWNDTLNYFDVSPEDGDVIKGLGVNANRLLIFKENSLYRYDTNTLYQVAGCPGTVAHRTIQNIQGWTLYLHTTGLWGYNGESSQLLSRKIKDIINGILTKNLEDANAWVHGDHYYLYVGDINNFNIGLSINKCLIDYDISKQVFTWRSLKDNPRVWMESQDSKANITYDDPTITYNDANVRYNAITTIEQKMHFGTDDGNVMQFNVGKKYKDGDITISIETKDYYLGYPAFWKVIQKIVVFSDYAGKGIVVQAKLDENDWVTFGKIKKPIQELIFPSTEIDPKCQRIRFRFMESSSGDRFNVEGIDIYYVAQGLIE